MKKQILLITIIISTLYFQSCASFKKNLINQNPLTEKTLTDLNGKYGISNSKADSVSNNYWVYNNFLTEIDRKLLKDTLQFDTLKTYHVELKVLNKKKLKISYLENSIIFRERIIKTKLKSDGYLYLKNKNVGFLFVPYIAGAIDIKKTRLTTSKNGNLIFDIANHRSGAFLIFIFLDGQTRKYRYEYNKLE